MQVTPPKLTDYQKEFLTDNVRFTITEAATKIGKTFSHIYWLYKKAHKIPAGGHVWWIAPVYGQSAIAFDRMRRRVQHIDSYTINMTQLTIKTPHDTTISFKSADKPDNLYGEDVHAVVFDEFTRAKEEAWFAIRSTLTATRGQCKFIGNVKGRGWGYKLAQKAKQGLPNWGYFRVTAWDAVEAGILEYDEIADAQAALPEHVFNELYLAIPSDDGSNPFGLKAIESCMGTLSQKPAIVYGIDLAKSSDWTVIIGLDEDRRVCYFDRFQNDWGETSRRVLSLPDGVPICADSTGVGDPIVEGWQKQRPSVYGYHFTSISKQKLMEGLQMDIHQQNITYPEGVIKDELDVFEYKYTPTGVRYSAPPGFHDDCVCSLALANHQFKNRVVFAMGDD